MHKTLTDYFIKKKNVIKVKFNIFFYFVANEVLHNRGLLFQLKQTKYCDMF